MYSSHHGTLPLLRPSNIPTVGGGARQEAVAPSVQILAGQLEFAPQGAHILARQYPADDAELELSVENTGETWTWT
jgi:hypothetical protein